MEARILGWGVSRFNFFWGLLLAFLLLLNNFSHARFFAVPWSAACQASLSSTISQSLLKLISIESVMPSNHLVHAIPFSSCLQSFPASGSFPRSKCLLISWLQSPSAVILATQNKVSHCFHCFSIYLPRSDATRCHDLCFLNVEL